MERSSGPSPWRLEIEMDLQNMDAMLISMNAIHGNGPDVPRDVSLEMVAKISTLADYYNCHKAIHLAVDLWTRPLQAKVVKGYCDDFLRWIWISWVFRFTYLFRDATYCAVSLNKGPISTIGLPIPQPIIEAIDKRREHGIKTTLDSLRLLVTDLRDGRKSCSFECDSFRLGALTKQLHEQGFLRRANKGTVPSISLLQLRDFLVTIKSPAWRDITPKPSGGRRHQDQHPGDPCTLQSMVMPILREVVNHMQGFRYNDFKEAP